MSIMPFVQMLELCYRLDPTNFVNVHCCTVLCVFVCRDGKEELMELDDEQRKQLQQRENSRLLLFTHSESRPTCGCSCANLCQAIRFVFVLIFSICFFQLLHCELAKLRHSAL